MMREDIMYYLLIDPICFCLCLACIALLGIFRFVRFANMLINDSIYHMDEAIKFLSAIKVAQVGVFIVLTFYLLYFFIHSVCLIFWFMICVPAVYDTAGVILLTAASYLCHGVLQSAYFF